MLVVDTYLHKSTISGIGCFAKEFISKGSIIWKLDRNFDTVIDSKQFDCLPKISKEFVNHFGYYNEEEGGWVLCMDNARYFNHSEDSNTDDSYEYTFAKRDILEGEEITCDYFSFDLNAEKKLKVNEKVS